MKTIDDLVLENDYWICEFIEDNLCQIPIFTLLEYLNIDLNEIYPVYGYLDSNYPVEYETSTIKSSRPEVLTECVGLKIVTNLKDEKFVAEPAVARVYNSKKHLVKSYLSKHFRKDKETHISGIERTGSAYISPSLLMKNLTKSEIVRLSKLYLATNDLLKNGINAIFSRYGIFISDIAVIEPKYPGYNREIVSNDSYSYDAFSLTNKH